MSSETHPLSVSLWFLRPAKAAYTLITGDQVSRPISREDAKNFCASEISDEQRKVMIMSVPAIHGIFIGENHIVQFGAEGPEKVSLDDFVDEVGWLLKWQYLDASPTSHEQAARRAKLLEENPAAFSYEAMFAGCHSVSTFIKTGKIGKDIIPVVDTIQWVSHRVQPRFK